MKPADLEKIVKDVKPKDELLVDTPMMRLRGTFVRLEGKFLVLKGTWSSRKNGEESGEAYLTAGSIRSLIVVARD